MQIKTGQVQPGFEALNVVLVSEGGGGILANDAPATVAEIVSSGAFDGKEGSALPVWLPEGRFLLVGVGAKPGPASFRRAGVIAAREAGKAKVTRLALAGNDATAADYHFSMGVTMGAYRYGEYKQSDVPTIESLTIAAHQSTADRTNTVSSAVRLARDLVNRPANALNPEALTEVARQIASAGGLSLEVWDRAECEKRGMGLYMAVARGSTNEPRFIRLSYTPENPSRSIAIVGKGVTFDTGGYDIKTADGMLTMKDDMAGAAAVIATMQAVAALKPEVAVTAYVAATDNVIAPDAMRPGDIYRGMTGKTVEILNTDAEGRLTLADALAQAFADGNDEVIDLATLTGACVVALGREVAGLWSNDDSLAERVKSAAAQAGEKVWRMPLEESYLKPLKNGLADLKNTVIPTPGGGAVLAALFLREFTSGPWAHLDIAGPAFMSLEHAEGPAGATGFGVRTLVEYLCPQR